MGLGPGLKAVMRATEKKKTDFAPLPQECPLCASSSADSALEQRETFNVLFCDSPSRKAEKQRGIHYSVSIRYVYTQLEGDDDDDRLGGVPSLVHVILLPVTVPCTRYIPTPQTLPRIGQEEESG